VCVHLSLHLPGFSHLGQGEQAPEAPEAPENTAKIRLDLQGESNSWFVAYWVGGQQGVLQLVLSREVAPGQQIHLMIPEKAGLCAPAGALFL